MNPTPIDELEALVTERVALRKKMAGGPLSVDEYRRLAQISREMLDEYPALLATVRAMQEARDE